MKAVAKPRRAAKRAVEKAPVRSGPSDARLVTAAVIAVAVVLAAVRIVVHPTGGMLHTYQVAMLCLVVAAVAGRLLLGYQPADQERAGWLSDRLALPLVFLVAVLPYLLTIGIGLLADDFAIELTAAGARGPAEAYLTNPLPGMYRQLFMLGWWVHDHVFGSAPLGHHLVNVLLHGVNALLVYVLARRLTRRTSASLIGALLFAVHPVHVEPVVWLCCQPDLLCALFSLLSLLSLDVYLQARRKWALAAAAVTFFFAMLGKEAALMLPALAVLLVWLRQPRPAEPRAAESAGFPPLPLRKTAFLVGSTYGLALVAYMAVPMSALHEIGGYPVEKDFWNTLFPTVPMLQILTFFLPVNQALTDHMGERVGLAVAVLVMTPFLVWCLLNLTRIPGRRLAFYGGSLLLLTVPIWLYRPPEADLTGTRWMYLPSVALCWFVGDVLAGRRSARRTALTAAALTAALALTVWCQMPWRAAARITDDVLNAAQRMVEQTPRSVKQPIFYVEDVPRSRDGAEVFPTSFGKALRLKVGRPVSAQTVGLGGEMPPEMLAGAPLLRGEYVYAYDEKARTFRLVREGRP